jgi:hypothetical protein
MEKLIINGESFPTSNKLFGWEVTKHLGNVSDAQYIISEAYNYCSQNNKKIAKVKFKKTLNGISLIFS